MDMMRKMSLDKKLTLIAVASFFPMLLALGYALVSLSTATTAYSRVTQSVTYANTCIEFKDRMDYSMYLAVIGKKNFETLGKEEITVNGIVTVHPLGYIQEMKENCTTLSAIATVDSNRYQMERMENILDSLEYNCIELERMIGGKGVYDENMSYLDNNIYMLTSIVEEGIHDYIRVETTNLNGVRAEQEAKNRTVYGVCVIVSLVAVMLSLLFSVNALRSVTKPIRKLVDLTQRVAKGDFTVKTKVEDTDEIAVLTRSFNEMTTEIGELVDDIKEKEKNLHLMETKLLQAQINPHFLYNTLDAIVWLAENNQNQEVISMVTSLSEFFRSTLSSGKDFITVKEEESHVESYLKIQRFRYQDIMDYEINLDKDIQEYVIPKLLLQPLVENALYHGVKNKRGKSSIIVRGVKENDNLIFTVSDNGKGMSESELQRVRDNMMKKADERKTNSFGLANINQRIRHYYGEEYGLFIESKEDVGTQATVIIRIKK